MVDYLEKKELVETLFTTYRRLAFYKAQQILRNCSDCEEIIQDAYVKVIENIDTVAKLSPSQQVSYLTKTVENLSINYARKQQRLNSIYLSDTEWANLPSNSNDLEEKLNQSEVKEKVSDILNSLSNADRRLLLGKYFLDLDAKDLAGSLGCSTKTLAVRIFRAKKRAISFWLKKELHADGQKTD